MSINPMESAKDLNERKLHISLVSTASVSSSTANSQEHANNKHNLETTCSTLKKSDSPMGLKSLLSSRRNSVEHENPELEVTKQILMEYKVPINKKIMTDLRNYIAEYGSIDRFQNALKSESERYKLNLFIAQTSANLISKSQKSLNFSTRAVQNNYVDTFKSN
jgi:hypothetical protein